jgi:NTE family protein
MQIHESGSLPAALRASAALPGVIPPAVIDRRLAIDGSVLNSLPVDIMRHKPVGKVIAVDLSSNKSYDVDYNTIPSPWSILLSRYLPFRKKVRVPSITTTLLKATEIGTQEKVRQARADADLLLQPPVRMFGITNVRAFDQIIEAGYRNTCEELKKWQAG